MQYLIYVGRATLQVKLLGHRLRRHKKLQLRGCRIAGCAAIEHRQLPEMQLARHQIPIAEHEPDRDDQRSKQQQRPALPAL